MVHGDPRAAWVELCIAESALIALIIGSRPYTDS